MKTIRVTATDIRNSKVSKINACPIERAMRRATGIRWLVDRFGAYRFFGNVLLTTLRIPPVAKKFVIRFDNYKSVKPFSFRVKI